MKRDPLFGALLALAVACGAGEIQAQSSTTASSPPTDVTEGPHEAEATLGFGDAVRISVWLQPALSGEFGITSEGTIAEPFYMDVRVAGVPLSIATESVRARVHELEANSRVLVEPLFSVGVAGEVRQPNLYTLAPETTVMQAIMLAGGPSRPFDQVRIRLDRDGRSIDLGPGGAEVEQIRSGDRIVLVRRTRVFNDVVLPTLSVLGSVASILRFARLF